MSGAVPSVAGRPRGSGTSGATRTAREAVGRHAAATARGQRPRSRPVRDSQVLRAPLSRPGPGAHARQVPRRRQRLRAPPREGVGLGGGLLPRDGRDSHRREQGNVRLSRGSEGEHGRSRHPLLLLGGDCRARCSRASPAPPSGRRSLRRSSAATGPTVPDRPETVRSARGSPSATAKPVSDAEVRRCSIWQEPPRPWPESGRWCSRTTAAPGTLSRPSRPPWPALSTVAARRPASLPRRLRLRRSARATVGDWQCPGRHGEARIVKTLAT